MNKATVTLEITWFPECDEPHPAFWDWESLTDQPGTRVIGFTDTPEILSENP